MAHRLAFPPNATVPLATRLKAGRGGWLTPFDPATEELLGPPARREHEQDAAIELLALDAAPIDGWGGASDSIWLSVTFTDAWGRRVNVRARGVAPGGAGEQRYGGVATNLVRAAPGAVPPGWLLYPLVGWARCDVLVDDVLSDADVLGVLSLTEASPSLGQAGAYYGSVSPTLTLHICPRRVLEEGRTASVPLRAAEEMGMAGWTFTWDDVSFNQAPVLPVRVEKGDTAARIARELAVDLEAVLRANEFRDSGNLVPGDLIWVPMLIRASGAVPRKEHPSVALTWKEIIRGWTTLN